MRIALACIVVAWVAVIATPTHAQAKPFLWQCEQIHLDAAKWRCYARLLYLDVQRSGDPAEEVPRLDRRVAGTPVQGLCHALMHEVGRRYGRAHHMTVGTLQRYVPRSNDPTCSAGFGMGLVMYLGPQIIRTGGLSALAECEALPTRYRSYTCIHGIGHALMRAYHGNLRVAIDSCRRLGPQAPDCAQGAFHDYWISLRGADETVRRAHGESPRTLCNGHLFYVRPCWFRYFVESPNAPIVETVRDVDRVCAGLRKLQRYGCVSAAALAMNSEPFAQTRTCARMRAADAGACLRGVVVQALDGNPRAQLRLLRECARMPSGERADCERWFGRALALVTDGRFRCPDATCRTGARDVALPIVTFS